MEASKNIAYTRALVNIVSLRSLFEKSLTTKNRHQGDFVG